MKYAPIEPEFADPEEDAAYDAWFRAEVQESLDDPRPGIPHEEAMVWIKQRMIERGHAKPDWSSRARAMLPSRAPLHAASLAAGTTGGAARCPYRTAPVDSRNQQSGDRRMGRGCCHPEQGDSGFDDRLHVQFLGYSD